MTGSEQERVRRDKLDRILAAGTDPYPVGFAPSTSAAELRVRFRHLEPGAATGERVAVAGRVVRRRDSGRLAFATIRDGADDVQIMLAADVVGDDALVRWKADVDLGDHVGVVGEVVSTRRGELSVRADRWLMTAKALHPLPDKHAGLTDPESRLRQRYLDLVVNPQARSMLTARASGVRALRDALSRRGFVEVETPMLQTVHGGANARPFVTRMNAYNLSLYLRIAPELYLKRLLVGGMERVYEINRVFRNEGVDSSHNPEFTALELYQAYADYDVMAVLTRELVQEAAVAMFGSTVIRRADGVECDIGGEWPAHTVHEAISNRLGEEVTPDTPESELRRLAAATGIDVDPTWSRGVLELEMYEHLVEGSTVGPTFYRDFPTEVSPLTRAHRRDPRLAERWDLVAFGTELGTAYTELNDPIEQRRRLTEQSLRAAGGDPEAMQLDEDFLRALEYGMPPAGGMGMGIDRMLMVLTGATIRDTILFPLIRPEGG